MKKIVLITGASRGIGESIAQKFLDNGDLVYVNFNTTSLEEVKNKYSNYKNVKFLKSDISNEEEVRDMINKIALDEEHLDILVNNAAICCDNEFNDKTKKEFEKVLSVNLIGTFLVCKYASKIMKEGSIINISSTNAIDTNETYSMDYDASKSGIISLTRNFAKALSPNIRVNAVSPGWVKTSKVLEMEPHYLASEKEKILLKRFAEPDEIANVVFFLASSDASYINGSVIRVDGGK